MMIHGDSLEMLKSLDADSVDAAVTDPPYGLKFMGKKWDHNVPSVELWREIFRVLKPGGHLLSFGGTRTYHRMVVNIEDAGFEIRDQIQWLYGSGFPKSHNISKAIDKAAGAKGKRGPMKRGGERLARLEDGKRDGEGKWGDESGRSPYTTLPETPEAKQWDGWGTALKPANEPICLARKPFKGTVAANVLKHGTGALNIDGCRVEGEKGVPASLSNEGLHGFKTGGDMARKAIQNGRWPANVIHDGSEEVLACFGDAESAARFFYCAKPSKKERNAGCEGLDKREVYTEDTPTPQRDKRQQVTRGNFHPTVKPIALMRYLCRLVTPPNGTVLDPFMGSGSTGCAAALEGFGFIGIEREAEYIEIAKARIEHHSNP
jgi:site-specific DNA-methyltransferase (adenine-specific)